MQSKTPILLVTALVCGLGAAFGTWKLANRAQENPVDEAKVKVLVPVAEVAPYYLFQDDKRFTEMEWPKSKLREGEEETIKTFTEIKGKTSRHYKLKPNEPIYKNDICESIENDVSERLQMGEVAHAVQVTAERAGGGFVQVGDRVDIEATVQPTGGETSIRTFFILEDVEVLAVDNQAQKAQNNMATPPTRFLLRVTRPQSIVLKFYQDTAKIDYVKRKLGDKNKVGESFYFTSGKKTSSVQGYNEDQPEATVAVNLEQVRLPDPKEDGAPAKVEKTDQARLTQEQEEIERLKKHKVVINDSGTPRIQDTNQTYKEIEKRMKETGKKEDPKKEENKNEGNGKKEDGKTPGQ